MSIPRRLAQWLPLVQEAGEVHGIEPLLVLAVLDRESLGGEALSPPGPGGTGDGGFGRGLMQIDSRWHGEFMARHLADGTPAWQNARENISYGASLLASGLRVFEGEVALAVAAYNCGPRRVCEALRELTQPQTLLRRLEAVDRKTTGHNYASDVLARLEKLKADALS